MLPPLPLDEAERLRVLQEYEILDSDAEPAFDDLTAIVAQLCATPMAFITLIDSDRQWILSHRGLDIRETPREHAFCAYTILDPQPLVVSDARVDERFADNPAVTGPPHIRFYAGAPLITPSGQELGSLCVIDTQPRELDTRQLTALQTLARQVVHLLELRRISRALADALGRARTLEKLLPICAWCKRVRKDQDYWTRVETYLTEQVGTEFTHGICPDCLARYFPD